MKPTENPWLQDHSRMQHHQRGLWLSENCGKPRNSTNNVSFAELMRQLRGEG